MEINFYAVLISAVISMVIGAIWYGPLFGEKWLKIIKISPEDLAKREEMKKNAGPLYALQFVLTIVTLGAFNYLIVWLPQLPIGCIAFTMWIGFIMPTIAGGAMWNNDSKEVSWARFLIQSGYQFVLFAAFAGIFSIFY